MVNSYLMLSKFSIMIYINDKRSKKVKPLITKIKLGTEMRTKDLTTHQSIREMSNWWEDSLVTLLGEALHGSFETTCIPFFICSFNLFCGKGELGKVEYALKSLYWEKLELPWTLSHFNVRKWHELGDLDRCPIPSLLEREFNFKFSSWSKELRST